MSKTCSYIGRLIEERQYTSLSTLYALSTLYVLYVEGVIGVCVCGMSVCCVLFEKSVCNIL